MEKARIFIEKYNKILNIDLKYHNNAINKVMLKNKSNRKEPITLKVMAKKK